MTDRVLKITMFHPDGSVLQVNRKQSASGYPWVASQLWLPPTIEGHDYPVHYIEVVMERGSVRYERDSLLID